MRIIRSCHNRAESTIAHRPPRFSTGADGTAQGKKPYFRLVKNRQQFRRHDLHQNRQRYYGPGLRRDVPVQFESWLELQRGGQFAVKASANGCLGWYRPTSLLLGIRTFVIEPHMASRTSNSARLCSRVPISRTSGRHSQEGSIG